MREILFRGKRVDNGEWVEGGYYIEKIGDYLTAAFIVENLTDGVHENHRVIPKSISEFTGLTDRNGKKIFEGDIVYDTIDRENALIVFENGSYYVKNRCIFMRLGESASVQIEVIGNIHANPELLKGDNDA